MWYRYHQGLWNNHAAYRWFKHKVAVCTDCRFSIHSTKICEITQLVDEVEFIENAIKTVKNFYRSFERRAKNDGALKDSSEVLVELDYFRKQYADIFGDYEMLNNPTAEQLLAIEKRLFEFRNTIQRGYTYNLLLKNKYLSDFKKRESTIQQLSKLETSDEKIEDVKDPEKLHHIILTLQKENERLQNKLDEQHGDLLETKKQLEDVSKEFEKCTKELEKEKARNEKSESDLLEKYNNSIQTILEKAINKKFTSLKTTIEEKFKAAQEESTKSASESADVKKNVTELLKVAKKINKETTDIINSTKNILPQIKKVETNIEGGATISNETKQEVNQVKKWLLSIQKDNTEIKRLVNEFSTKIDQVYAQPIQISYDMINQPVAPMGMIAPSIGMNPNDDEDDDLYMDDEVRKNAEEEIKNRTVPVTPVATKENKEPPKMISYESGESQSEPIELLEITHQDLQDILTEFLEQEFSVDEFFELSIDCSDYKHQNLLDHLSTKILPPINSVVLCTLDPQQEIVANFLWRSLQNGINTIVFNEYCSTKIPLNYYVRIIEYLLQLKLIRTSLVIRDVEMDGDSFNILMNSAVTSPISLEINRTSITELNELKITSSPEDFWMWGLEIIYSDLNDNQAKIIVEELVRSEVARKLSSINLQGNNINEYDYRTALSSFTLDIEG